MSTRYSPAATRGTDAAPAPASQGVGASSASAAPALLPRAARHQLWHLNSSLRRSLAADGAGLGHCHHGCLANSHHAGASPHQPGANHLQRAANGGLGSYRSGTVSVRLNGGDARLTCANG